MSTFNGQFQEKELEFIRADDFQKHNYDGTIFLLSHPHTDHMRGIFDGEFLKMLNQEPSNVMIMSPATRAVILKNPDCRIPADKIKGLKLNSPFTVKNPSHPHQDVTITLLPAGHCPGAVMFLMEYGMSTRVLYTGDIRIPIGTLKKFNYLHYKDGGVKEIDKMYLDTTFCDSSYRQFPPRTFSEDRIVELIDEWLQADSKNVVGIQCTSYFGLEALLGVLTSRLGKPIYIPQFKMVESYRLFPDLNRVISDDDEERIHLCPIQKWKCQFCNKPEKEVRVIRPCAMTFKDATAEEGEQVAPNGLIRVPYSNHASLNELAEFVRYLKPKSIYPCVVPSTTSEEEVLKHLEREMELIQRMDNGLESEEDLLHLSVFPNATQHIEDEDEYNCLMQLATSYKTKFKLEESDSDSEFEPKQMKMSKESDEEESAVPIPRQPELDIESPPL